MIPDSLFLPFSKSLFLPSQSPVSPFSKSLFRPVQSPVPVLLKVPFLLPPSPFPLLSVLFPPLKVLSHPPPSPAPVLPDSRSSPLPSYSSKPKKTAERHESVPPFGVWLVPKWNMILSLIVLFKLNFSNNSRV